MDMVRFHADQKLDPTQLDLAAALQGELFFYWAEQAVAARRMVDHTKLALELEENRLSLECRQDPESFGLTKATEAAITAAIKVNKEYQIASTALMDARHESNLLDAAVSAMEQRKRMIEVLITLHGQQYFAGPSVPRDLGAAWSKHQEDREASLASMQQDRVRKPRKVNR